MVNKSGVKQTARSIVLWRNEFLDNRLSIQFDYDRNK